MQSNIPIAATEFAWEPDAKVDPVGLENDVYDTCYDLRHLPLRTRTTLSAYGTMQPDYAMSTFFNVARTPLELCFQHHLPELDRFMDILATTSDIKTVGEAACIIHGMKLSNSHYRQERARKAANAFAVPFLGFRDEWNLFNIQEMDDPQPAVRAMQDKLRTLGLDSSECAAYNCLCFDLSGDATYARALIQFLLMSMNTYLNVTARALGIRRGHFLETFDLYIESALPVVMALNSVSSDFTDEAASDKHILLVEPLAVAQYAIAHQS